MKIELTKSFSTAEFHGHDVKYAPFNPNLLACAASENYGIAGRGRLFVLNISSNPISIVAICDWIDGLFDVTWSEIHECVLVTSCGDGSIRLWDFRRPKEPVAYYKIHEREVYSVEWNPKNAYPYILSASWDHTVKLWDPFAAKEIAAFIGHSDQVFEAVWSPNKAEEFASVSGDSTLRIWDMRIPAQAVAYSLHNTDALSCDWSKTDPDVIAVGSCDGKIYGWDRREMRQPLFCLAKHEYAIRRLKFNPFHRGFLASVSYDLTTGFWAWEIPQPIQMLKKHTEFVFGLDYSPIKPGQVCDCSWDSQINVYQVTL